jgi:hypothetical protein
VTAGVSFFRKYQTTGESGFVNSFRTQQSSVSGVALIGSANNSDHSQIVRFVRGFIAHGWVV